MSLRTRKTQPLPLRFHTRKFFTQMCNKRNLVTIIILTVMLNTPLTLEILNKSGVKIPHLQSIEIAAITVQVIAIITTLIIQLRREKQFYKGRKNVHIREGQNPTCWNSNKIIETKHTLASEWDTLKEWNKPAPIQYFMK